jgi:hypothetical protein
MKTVNENIIREVNRTLESLGGIRKASPKPYFYSRIIARREKLAPLAQTVQEASPALIRVTVSAMFILFFISLYSVITVQKNEAAPAPPAPTGEVQNFIEDYYPQTPTVYNLDEKINQ